MELIGQLLDPSTFWGSVLAAAVGVGVVTLAANLWKLARTWWSAVNQFTVSPYTPVATLDDFFWGKDRRTPKAISAHTESGCIDFTFASSEDWPNGALLEVMFVKPRVRWLPGWVPLNIMKQRPRVSCRGVTIDPQMGGNFTLGSSGYLQEREGAYRTDLVLSESEFIPAKHEIKLTVRYTARTSFSGLMRVSVRIDHRWRHAFCPVSVVPQAAEACQ